MAMKPIQPANDSREIFAGDFYRHFAPVDDHFMISPAAVMKALFVISQGTHEALTDQILWDLAIKHVKGTSLMEESKRLGVTDVGACMEIAQKLRDEQNRPIDQKLLLEFLKNDFTELDSDIVTIKNYIVSSERYTFNEEFQDFAESYFNFSFLHKEMVGFRRSIDLRFSECLTQTDLDIFGLVEFKLNFWPPFEMYEDGTMGAFGEFKYVILEVATGFDFRAEIVEIPLQTENNLKLSMLVFLPSDLVVLLKRNIGRDYTDFNEISNQLEMKIVDIKLPNMNLQKKYNLTQHFTEQSENGLRDLFSEPVNLKRMFDGVDTTELRVGCYCQHTTLVMTAPKTTAAGRIKAEKTTDVIFDVRKKSFFYVIKSEKVLYVMGHFYKEQLGKR